MSVNARTEEFERVELFGVPALFSNNRIDRITVPDGLLCYDLRGSDNDPGMPVTVEPSVRVNHTGTVITTIAVDFNNKGYRRLRGKLNFLGYSVSLAEFLAEQS